MKARSILLCFLCSTILISDFHLKFLFGNTSSANIINDIRRNNLHKNHKINNRLHKNIIPQKKTKLISPRIQLSVVSFGAVGNGVVDDTIAIQKTIDAVSAQGGGVVLFPTGTYRVTIQSKTSYAITIDKNVTLQGTGAETSIIKLGDRQGNYNAILAGNTPSSDLSNFVINGLTIDGNSINNPVTSESNFKEFKERYALRLYVGNNIHIENCKFTNFTNVNVITANNDTLVSDVYIQNNRFENIGGSLIDFDHSSIYLHGKRGRIINNVFLSKNGAGTNSARSAIEIHGDGHTVSGNTISGFTNGILVTGYASSSKGQTITNNIIREAHIGVSIWSYYFLGKQPLIAVEDCVISENQIYLNIKSWRKLWGGSPSQGISFYPNSNSSVRNIQITKNLIQYTNNDGGRSTDTIASGINLWRNATPNLKSYNINISKNTIKNSIASGIYVSMPIDKLVISQNKIINPGIGKYRFDSHYRSGIILRVPTTALSVNNNEFIDDQAINTLKFGMILAGRCPSICIHQGNTITAANGTRIPLMTWIP